VCRVDGKRNRSAGDGSQCSDDGCASFDELRRHAARELRDRLRGYPDGLVKLSLSLRVDGVPELHEVLLDHRTIDKTILCDAKFIVASSLRPAYRADHALNKDRRRRTSRQKLRAV